jgi:hypothetical protein
VNKWRRYENIIASLVNKWSRYENIIASLVNKWSRYDSIIVSLKNFLRNYEIIIGCLVGWWSNYGLCVSILQQSRKQTTLFLKRAAHDDSGKPHNSTALSIYRLLKRRNNKCAVNPSCFVKNGLLFKTIFYNCNLR